MVKKLIITAKDATVLTTKDTLERLVDAGFNLKQPIAPHKDDRTGNIMYTQYEEGDLSNDRQQEDSN